MCVCGWLLVGLGTCDWLLVDVGVCVCEVPSVELQWVRGKIGRRGGRDVGKVRGYRQKRCWWNCNDECTGQAMKTGKLLRFHHVLASFLQKHESKTDRLLVNIII